MIIVIDNNLRLELVDQQYGQPLYELVKTNMAHLQPWLPWVRHVKSQEFINNFVVTSRQRSDNGTEYAFVILSHNKVVGRIGVYKIDCFNHIGEIGYWLSKEETGKGIAARSCRVLVDYCFNNFKLNRIEIRCGVTNHKSQAIPQRLGFLKEGVVRQGELLSSGFTDLLLYSLLKEEWQV